MHGRCLVIVPTYNEVLNITLLLRSIIKVDKRVDILIIDDSSPDGTAQVIRTEFLSDDRVTLLSRKKKLGLGSAYVEGFQHAIKRGYSYVMEMDADLAHKPEYIPYFLDNMIDSDLVLGSRYVKGGQVLNWSFWRKFIYRCGVLYSKIILGTKVNDLTCGFKCFRTEILNKIDLNKISSSGYSFQMELTYLVYLLGGRIKEIPIIFEDKRVGKSRLSRQDLFKAMMKVHTFRLMGKKHPALKSDG